MNRAFERVQGVLVWAGAIAVFSIMAITFMDVVLRALAKPFVAALDATELLMVVAVWGGGLYATMRKSHVRIELLGLDSKPVANACLNIVSSFIMLLMLLMVTGVTFYKGLDMVYRLKQVTVNVSIPVFPFFFFMSLASLAASVEVIRQITGLVRSMPTASAGAVKTGHPPA